MTFLIGILAGFCIALMSAVNERLRAHLGAPFLTACVSFTVGLAFILPMAVFGGGTFPFSGETAAAAPWWAWCGGLLGLMSLSAVVITFPKLGAVQAAVMPILGQMLAGVMIDAFGWLNAPQTAFSGSRLFGVLLVLAGIFAAVVLPNRRTLHAQADGRIWLWRSVGVFGGACMATQAAVNGELGQILASPASAAAVSFLVGTAGLWLLVLLYEKSADRLVRPMQGKPVWIWLGGGLSALFIYASARLVPQIGTGSVVVLMLAGSVSGSLLVDKFGLLGVAKKPVGLPHLTGTALLLAGVGLIRLI